MALVVRLQNIGQVAAISILDHIRRRLLVRVVRRSFVVVGQRAIAPAIIMDGCPLAGIPPVTVGHRKVIRRHARRIIMRSVKLSLRSLGLRFLLRIAVAIRQCIGGFHIGIRRMLLGDGRNFLQEAVFTLRILIPHLEAVALAVGLIGVGNLHRLVWHLARVISRIVKAAGHLADQMTVYVIGMVACCDPAVLRVQIVAKDIHRRHRNAVLRVKLLPERRRYFSFASAAPCHISYGERRPAVGVAVVHFIAVDDRRILSRHDSAEVSVSIKASKGSRLLISLLVERKNAGHLTRIRRRPFVALNGLLIRCDGILHTVCLLTGSGLKFNASVLILIRCGPVKFHAVIRRKHRVIRHRIR